MPLARPFTVKVLSSLLPQSVTVNGVPAEYRYSAEDFALLVDLPELPCNQEKVIKIIYPSGKVDIERTFRGIQKNSPVYGTTEVS